MKLRDYFLNESILIVSFNDLPEWVKSIMKSKSMKKDVEVIIDSDVNLPGNWHDNNIMEIFAYKNGKVNSEKVIGGQTMFDKPKETAIKKGLKFKLNPGEMILVTYTHPKMAKLYAHPNDMNKIMLDEPTSKDELTPEEIVSLSIVKSLKSVARKEEAMRYGLQFDEIKQSLIKKGYLAKNGSINTKGKNALLKYSEGKYVQLWSLADKLGVKRK
jgi:hypothetical protein